MEENWLTVQCIIYKEAKTVHNKAIHLARKDYFSKITENAGNSVLTRTRSASSCATQRRG